VANGTEALELALRCAGVKPGADVVVPSHTAYATVAAILRLSATPRFVDISSHGSTLCLLQTQEILERNPDVAAVVAVHLYGEACDLGPLQRLCRQHGVALIEDCAQATGTTYQNQKIGTWGDFAAFSFYPTKNLGAVGDGGMVVINAKASDERISHIRRMRLYGWDDQREAVQFGINSRLDELQAWILAGKLENLDEQIHARRRLADLYRERLSGLAADGLINLPKDGDHWCHSYHLFVIQMEPGQRDEILLKASQEGIPLAVHYSKACHQHPFIVSKNYPEVHLSNTESVVSRVLSLPFNPYLIEDDIALICDFVSNFFRR
jgi:dTDP-4-amino-4,6-dideoxygalactose transaminase